jgi:VIT1/CCC1 family predicted Fe2+/Mn2+ transporter
LILGVSNVLADGFSMASSNYLSEKSHSSQSGETSINKPMNTALATFVSFVIVGSIPLLSYFISYIFNIWQGKQFMFAIVFTSLAFILIGQVRGKITNTNRFNSVLETIFIGGVAALVAYYVGALLKYITI